MDLRDKLLTAAKKLNETTDRAADVVRKTNDFLRENRIGTYGEAQNDLYFMSYERAEGQWQICAGAIEAPARPWSSLSREGKIRSFELLPSLLEVLLKNAEAELARAEESVLSTAIEVDEALRSVGVAKKAMGG